MYLYSSHLFHGSKICTHLVPPQGRFVESSVSHTHASGTQLVQAARAVAVAAHCSTHKAAASYTPGSLSRTVPSCAAFAACLPSDLTFSWPSLPWLCTERKLDCSSSDLLTNTSAFDSTVCSLACLFSLGAGCWLLLRDLVHVCSRAREYWSQVNVLLLDVVFGRAHHKVCVADAPWRAVCYQHAAN